MFFLFRLRIMEGYATAIVASVLLLAVYASAHQHPPISPRDRLPLSALPRNLKQESSLLGHTSTRLRVMRPMLASSRSPRLRRLRHPTYPPAAPLTLLSPSTSTSPSSSEGNATNLLTGWFKSPPFPPPPSLNLPRTFPNTGLGPVWLNGLCNASLDELCGVVMQEPIRLYIIWYGRFTASEKRVVRDFIASISDTSDPQNTVRPWWILTTQYFDSNGRNVSSSVTLKGEANDYYSEGKRLDSNKTWSVIAKKLHKKALLTDKAGIYAVLSDRTVRQIAGRFSGGGFCVAYCAWHDERRYSSLLPPISFHVPYFWAGDPSLQCAWACSWFTRNERSPNGQPGMDAIVNVLAHELAEAASDPFIKSWMDFDGNENADLCNFQFLERQTDASTGASYNLVGVNNRKFLIQAQWNLYRGVCAMSL